MLCFRKLPVAKKFMVKRRGGEYQEFPLTVLKIPIWGEFFSVSLLPVTEKFG